MMKSRIAFISDAIALLTMIIVAGAVEDENVLVTVIGIAVIILAVKIALIAEEHKNGK